MALYLVLIQIEVRNTSFNPFTAKLKMYNTFMKKSRFLLIFLVALAIVAMILGLWRPLERRLHPTSNPKSSEAPQVSILVSGLEVPWALSFLPDRDLLVTERKGRVLLIDLQSGKPVIKVVAKINEVASVAESGLSGIAVHPHFQQNHWIYLYYTYRRNGRYVNKVVRYELMNNQLTNPKIILDNILAARTHDGGRIKFGPDGYLYITTGDAQVAKAAQNPKSLAGKILRIKDDGSIPADNPFPGSPVYSYGHRNSQGIAWDKAGNLWSTEHGSDAHDEINLIKPGKNYGWPIVRGNEKRSDMESPILQSGEATWAPAGAAIIGEKLYFAGLRGEALYVFNIKTHDLHKYFEGEFGRLRAVVVGPDGLLYVTTSNRDGRGLPRPDEILVINPKKL
ncbi:PQQ-dependent sugar dehydrogenase [Coxiella burnetii]|uniref:PQQ-dependent sugar dehydrogenase n=1 Tax=Coxiella burnetii TaxID=777 RepID=UPI000183D13D|nr:PQQ-dependent sugar dehydrogenase [Coxiella burnetii]ACJ19834.1 hypothetical exported protein [Coxiella burnetii CbuK_Q154]EAX33354.2 glucose sorbosone dehydrogenase [Coxiella burnetii 'MSU Goat Q177']UYK70049.1 PQQ-dependent sugar dehydrogenase [Coxiella burnetii]